MSARYRRARALPHGSPPLPPSPQHADANNIADLCGRNDHEPRRRRLFLQLARSSTSRRKACGRLACRSSAGATTKKKLLTATGARTSGGGRKHAAAWRARARSRAHAHVATITLANAANEPTTIVASGDCRASRRSSASAMHVFCCCRCCVRSDFKSSGNRRPRRSQQWRRQLQGRRPRSRHRRQICASMSQRLQSKSLVSLVYTTRIFTRLDHDDVIFKHERERHERRKLATRKNLRKSTCRRARKFRNRRRDLNRVVACDQRYASADRACRSSKLALISTLICNTRDKKKHLFRNLRASPAVQTSSKEKKNARGVRFRELTAATFWSMIAKYAATSAARVDSSTRSASYNLARALATRVERTTCSPGGVFCCSMTIASLSYAAIRDAQTLPT